MVCLVKPEGLALGTDMLSSADSLASVGDIDGAIKIYTRITQNETDDSLAMVSLVRLAQVYIFDRPDADSSSYYLQRLQKLCNLSGNHRCHVLYNSIYNFMSKQKKDFVSAILYSENAIEYLDSSTEDLWFNVFNNYANTFENLGEYASARENYKRALDSTIPVPTEDSLLAWINISATFRNNPDSVIYYSNNGLKICQSQHIENACQMLYNNITWALAEKGQYTEALALVKKYFNSRETLNSNIEFSPALSHTTGYIYLQLKEYDKAIELFNESLPSAKESYDIPLILSNLDDLAASYYQVGEFEKSYQLLKERKEYADILHKEEIKSEIIRYENTKSFKEMTVKIQVLEDESFTMSGINKKLRIGVFSLATIGLIATILFYIRRQKNLAKFSKLNEEISLANLASLSATMNPHFIFNAFNTLQNFILKNDQDKAEDYLAKLSGLFRNILSYSDDISITLEKEVDVLQSYFLLEKERFQNEVDFQLHIDSELIECNPRIPAMIIQPHLENAIHHGVSKMNRNGVIKVIIEKNGKYLNCIVKDNGIGRKKSSEIKNKKNHNSIASKNSNRRIQLLKKLGYDNVQMSIKDITNGKGASGTEVHLLLPLLTKRIKENV